MTENHEIDWRIAIASTLAEDLPPSYPGGPSFKKGDYVFHTTMVDDNKGSKATFITPQPAALCLNVAIKAARQGMEIKGELAETTPMAPSPSGSTNCFLQGDIGLLYDYLEAAMVASSFSYMAVEAFANNEILSKASGPIEAKVKGRRDTFALEDIEKKLSTEDKICQVLPKLFSVSTPKGKKVWDGFKKLQKSRDAAVHIKYRESIQINDLETLYSALFFSDLLNYPRFALDVIRWFYSDTEPLIWISKASSEISTT